MGDAENSTALLSAVYNVGVGDENQNEKKSLWADTDLRKRILLAYLMIGKFLTNFCISSPSPFLARVVLEKGGDLVSSVIILQVTSLILSLSSIVFGKFQPYFGCKRLFIGGTSLIGINQVAFGFLEQISSIHAFVIVGTTIRVLQGVGQGALAVSIMTLVCQEYPYHISKVFGITETAAGAGYLVGPFLSGMLYDAGGLILSMTVTGGITLLAISPAPFLLRAYFFDKAEEGKLSISDLLWNVKALLILGATGAVMGGFAFCDSILTNYVKALGYSATEAGLVLFTIGASYCVGSVASGYAASVSVWVRRLLIVIGYVGSPLSGLIYTNNQCTIWIYLGSVVTGLMFALGYVSAFKELLLVVGGTSVVDDTSLYLHSTVSGLWYGVVGMNMFALSLIGAAVNDLLGHFSLAFVAAIAAGYAFTLVISGLAYVIQKCYT